MLDGRTREFYAELAGATIPCVVVRVTVTILTLDDCCAGSAVT
jgi:hypothetical protein